MSKRSNGRWRDSRDSIPAKRRRRRHHRRHTKRGGTYYPIAYDLNVAQNGVRNRLTLGVVCLLFAISCVVTMTAPMMSHFALAALLTFGFCSLCAGAALIASARREESVHRLAAEPSLPQIEHNGVDGTL